MTSTLCDSLVITIFVPEYQMSLCCSKVEKPESKEPQNKKYDLRTTEEGKARLQAIIDTVQQAPDNAITIRPNRKNTAFEAKVRQHNKEVREWRREHPDDTYTKAINPKDLVRLIDMKHYEATFKDDYGTEMHSFENIWVPQLTDDFTKVIYKGGKPELVTLTLYVKLRKVGDAIDVVSLHTGEEN